MDVLFYIPAGLVLLVATIVVTIKYRKRHEAERKQRILQWDLEDLERTMDSADAGNTEAQNLLLKNVDEYIRMTKSGGNQALQLRLEQLHQDIQSHRQYASKHAQISDVLAERETVSGNPLKERIKVAVKLAQAFNGVWPPNLEALEVALGISQEEACEQLRVLVDQRITGLAAIAGDDFEAFTELREILDDSHEYRGKLPSVGISKLPYPEKWNQWVAQHYANPSVRDFKACNDLHPGELGLRAAAALREENHVEAKLVLAYTNTKPEYGVSWRPQAAREELGILREDLIKMVEAYNHELGFEASVISLTESPSTAA